ncbi:alpha-mannosidase, partial [Cyanobium gracile UHCC 0281]|nr:alpha-mannosidase [Cyanobium gracile UHCC 0281]
LALLPCPGGWRAAAAPQQATRLREPLWCRPVAAAGGSAAPAETLFPSLGDDLQLVALRPLPADGDQGRARQALLSVQNLGPCRRRLSIGPDWTVLERCDGLGQGLGGGGDPLQLTPWQLGHWTLQKVATAQSS